MSRWVVVAVEFDMQQRSIWFTRGDFWTEYANVTPASFRRLLRAIENAPAVGAVLAPPAAVTGAPSELVSGQLGLELPAAATSRRG